MTIGHEVMNEIDCLDDCSLIKDDMYIEIIKLMIEVISLSRQKKIVIELGDLSFVNNLLSKLNISEDNKLKLIDLINLKSKSEIKDFFKDYDSKLLQTVLVEFLKMRKNF